MIPINKLMHLGLAMLLLSTTPASAQRSLYDKTPNALPTLAGDKTAKGYRLTADGLTIYQANHGILRLPAMPRTAQPTLLGLLRHGEDTEVFVDWTAYDDPASTTRHHLEVFRGTPGTTAVLVQELSLSGGPGASIRFFQPPDPAQDPTVFINIMGETDWSTIYLLASDRKSTVKLFTAYDYEFADLDHDGGYELIAWNRRPFDIRCGFAIADVRYYPEVFVPAGSGYQRAWPPADWSPAYGGLEGRFKDHEKEGVPWGANLQIVAGFADLEGNGTADLVVLQDRFREEPAQSLAIYKLNKTEFVPVTQVSLPPERIAFLLEGIRSSPQGKEILVRSATPDKCNDGGDYEASGTYSNAYKFPSLLPK